MVGNCLNIDQIFDYLDGKLDLNAELNLELHIEHCLLCKNAIAGAQRITDPDQAKKEIKNIKEAVLKRLRDSNKGYN